MNRWPNYCPKEVSCTCCEGLGDSHAGLLKLRCAFDPPFALQLIFSFSQQWRHVCNLFLFQDLYLQLRTALNWVDVRGLRIFLWVCWAVKPGGFHRKLQSGSAFLRQFFFFDLGNFYLLKAKCLEWGWSRWTERKQLILWHGYPHIWVLECLQNRFYASSCLNTYLGGCCQVERGKEFGSSEHKAMWDGISVSEHIWQKTNYFPLFLLFFHRETRLHRCHYSTERGFCGACGNFSAFFTVACL